MNVSFSAAYKFFLIFCAYYTHTHTHTHTNRANMLKRCWAYEAEDRPSIQVLIDELTSKPLLLKPCLDLPIPQLDPKDASTSAKANFKNLFPRQWASRLSTSSTTGLLVRYRNTFARTGSVQSPDRSPDAAHRVSEERFFNYPSNVASRDVSTAVESRSEAGLDEAEERFLLKRIGVKRAFVRCGGRFCDYLCLEAMF